MFNILQMLFDLIQLLSISIFIELIDIFNFFTQTLTVLNLESNRIGNDGAKHLADALRTNAVNFILSLHLSRLYPHFSTQTIVALNLRLNKITAEGVRHLAETLRNNMVTLFIYSPSTFTFSF